MKLYQLKVNNVLLAISKDKWLIELFIVQRKFKDKKYELIKTSSESTMIYMDIFLMYFMGYAITQDELRYINEITGEHESNIAYQIFSLQCIMNDNIKLLTNKEIKNIKGAIKALKKIRKMSDDDFCTCIDDIIERPGIIREFIDGIDMFKQYWRGDL